ncbi:50S ribosome-binding GTPase [soil metagenome]
MSGAAGVAERVNYLCDRAMLAVHGTELAGGITSIRQRMSEPLRVAIAGRVKAGKSTLLNGLVGERLAPTDAGECTKVVSWYRQGFGYEVRATLMNGDSRELRFRRDDGRLDINLGRFSVDDIQRIDVAWPSSNLTRMTLIDTPGLASLSRGTSVRTHDFLALDDGDRQSDADAVLYLMRHMHRRDAEFLEAFSDDSLANTSPVNAIAVLSRADEIGAGRDDALESASAIARRYSKDERVRALSVSVLPVAGLLAETGATIQEHETASLRELARIEDDELRRMLLSVDRFLKPEASDLLVETRRELLERLGLFGVRLSVQKIRSGEAVSAVDLSRILIETSGLDELRNLLEQHFTARAMSLKGRSALLSLRSCARKLSDLDRNAGRQLLGEIEQVEISTHAFAELRLLHMMLTGQIKLNDQEQAEVNRLTGGGTLEQRAGLDPDATDEQIQQVALDGIARWRQRASSPLLNRTEADAFEIAARSYEGIYAQVAV